MTGPELKALRNRLGLSVSKAARQCDVAERSFARWESGERAVPDGIERVLKREKRHVRI